MHQTTRDFWYAARTLRKNPGFALTAVATIALGIGASTAIFSVLSAVLLRPLPYPDPNRLMIVWGDLRNRNIVDFPFSPPDFDDFRREATRFEGLAAVAPGRVPLASEGGEPEIVRVGAVTPNFFSLLGARVALGRDFNEQDAVPQPAPPQAATAAGGVAAAGAPAPPQLPTIAILSHGLWMRRYGGDPHILGRSIDLAGGRTQVVGVLEPGFELLFAPGTTIDRAPDVWTALRVNYATAGRNDVFLRVIGRLKKNVTIEQAQAQVNAIATDLRQHFPIKQTAGFYVRVEPMHQDLVRDSRPVIVALMGAVLFLLLIACANVANLVLVRASWRERELAVRSALGAGRSSLVWQMLAESLLIAAGGAAAGLGLARLGIKLLVALGPEDLPRLDAVTIDPMVLAFTALAALAAAAMFGIVPALRASRPELVEALRSSGRTAGLAGGRRLRSAVVVAEVALSFVLLIGSGLMVRSLVALQHVDPGFEPRGVLTFFLAGFRGPGPARATFIRQLQERLRGLPGVEAVTAASPLPLDGGIAYGRWGTEEAVADPGKFHEGDFHFVLPGYFEALHTRLIAGRTYTDADNVPGVRRLVIDEDVAAKAFPNRSAVGKRLLVRARTPEPEWFEVIGVVAHQRHGSLARAGREAMFLTDAYMGQGVVARWAVRAAGDPARLGPAIRAEVAHLDPRLVVSEMQPMQKFVDHAQAQTRFALVLIGVFAAIAAVLAAVGLYGVLSAVVRQRTAEIGVRMALGAAPSGIFRLMVGQGLGLSVAGIAIGLILALALTRSMTTLLVGVAPTDPMTFAAMAILFLLIAGVSAWLPARRAALLDPTVALREE
ncbi:MAG TPA: ABC transporter permease [Bryobacteraceae bacterium]|nr:ABC transporter permease [Bryobacteraceae bacterium]